MPRYNQPRKTWKYTKDFKVKAVKLSYQPDIQVKQVAEGLDIHPFMLSRWRKEYREGKLQGDNQKRVGVTKHKTTVSQRELRENARLKQENARLKKENDLLKKATVSGGTTSERFGFIQRHGQELGVRYLCNWLGVSTSGYYAWSKRKEPRRIKEDRRLLILIEAIYYKSRCTYGSPRVYQALKKQGVRVGRKRVERLMRQAGLQARAMKYYRQLAGLHRFFMSIGNLRTEVGKPKAINQQWVADLTYIKVGKQWRYLAIVMDLYSRRIIGWSLSQSKNTKLTIAALMIAIKRRRPEKGLIFHTDRGSEYRSYDVLRVLKTQGIIPSMNRPYHSVDNAEMESFFKSLKGDVIRGKTYMDEVDLRSDLCSYINYFYNRERLHSSLGYRSPVEFEAMQA
ncbi:IS3 family transposase [Candidatus Thiodiazotropha sp. LNASS1]